MFLRKLTDCPRAAACLCSGSLLTQTTKRAMVETVATQHVIQQLMQLQERLESDYVRFYSRLEQAAVKLGKAAHARDSLISFLLRVQVL